VCVRQDQWEQDDPCSNSRSKSDVGVLWQCIYVVLWFIQRALFNIHKREVLSSIIICVVLLQFCECFFLHNVSWCLCLCYTDVYEWIIQCCLGLFLAWLKSCSFVVSFRFTFWITENSFQCSSASVLFPTLFWVFLLYACLMAYSSYMPTVKFWVVIK
jgi:hypothetical protein